MLSSTHLMVVIIVAMALIAGVMRARYRGGAIERERPGDDAETQRMKEEVKTLRARVAVLERIVTDKEQLLDQEIERLRDR